jgi:hypothetical protein
MGRRRFDRLLQELSVALDRWVARYPLWQAVHAAGFDPERWTGPEVERFCLLELPRWLRNNGYSMSETRVVKIARTLARFDPSYLTPEEHFARLSD